MILSAMEFGGSGINTGPPRALITKWSIIGQHVYRRLSSFNTAVSLNIIPALHGRIQMLKETTKEFPRSKPFCRRMSFYCPQVFQLINQFYWRKLPTIFSVTSTRARRVIAWEIKNWTQKKLQPRYLSVPASRRLPKLQLESREDLCIRTVS